MTLSALCDFALRARYADLPADAIRQARRCLLDLVGVATAGRRTALSGIVHRFAATQLGAGVSPGARMLFDNRRASAAGAALAGASTIDSFDAHDGHALTKGHAGVAILPALLAVADAEQLAGKAQLDSQQLLATLVIGYEIATRAGIALHASACDYHTSGAWNALGCAAVSARLLGLDDETLRQALGIAEYHGPRSQMMRCIDHPTMLKDGSGWGAFAGVSAAYLARDGFTGAPALTIEAPDQASIWGDLGRRWYILEQYLKPWPVCRWAQPSIEAAASLLADWHGSADEIARVEVETFHQAVRLGASVPTSTEAAQYALGFPLAAFLVRRRLGADEIGPQGLADAAIAAMTRRIVLKEDATFSRAFPAERWARVHVLLKSGRRLSSQPCTARGEAPYPLDDDAIVQKFGQLAEQLDPARRDRILSCCLSSASWDAGTLLDSILAP